MGVKSSLFELNKELLEKSITQKILYHGQKFLCRCFHWLVVDSVSCVELIIFLAVSLKQKLNTFSFVQLFSFLLWTVCRVKIVDRTFHGTQNSASEYRKDP